MSFNNESIKIVGNSRVIVNEYYYFKEKNR